MKVKWAVQNNLRRQTDVNKLTDFFDSLDVEWDHFALDMTGSCNGYENIPTDGLTIFYGSTGLVHRVYADRDRWIPGVFFEPTRFEYSSLLNGYGNHLLNADSKLMNVDQILSYGFSDHETFFARPATDTKIFTGEVFTFKRLKAMFEESLQAGGRLKLDTMVQIARSKDVLYEYRNIMVDGKSVASGGYGAGGRGMEVPDYVTQYAEQMALLYQPAEVFTLDVCEMSDGSMKIVETNCFNCSGLYWCDVYEIVTKVNEFVVRKYS